jgi:hypothetical protein
VDLPSPQAYRKEIATVHGFVVLGSQPSGVQIKVFLSQFALVHQHRQLNI